MPHPGPAAARLTLYLDGTTLYHHRPAYAEIVHRAHRDGLAGATVLHGTLGFGADGQPGGGRKGPYAVLIVDDERRLRAFLDSIEDVLEPTAALVVLDPVRVHGPGHRSAY
ncbi:DUF190 domain-containing protein [Streptomyces boninensis]|uniref:DUF190 domain-containing protein n=1 Tax=Streptomyces boninensis TaxID=2039455 RepID=UPI003B20D432